MNRPARRRVTYGVTVLLMGSTLAVIAAGYAMPGHRSVVETRSLSLPADRLHAQLADLETWPRWSAWRQELDPSARSTVTGAPGVGKVFAFRGDRIGDGRVEITEVQADRVSYALTFTDAPPSTGTLLLRATESESEITWRSELELGNNPIMRLIGPFIAGQLRRDIATGLDGLAATVPGTQSATDGLQGP